MSSLMLELSLLQLSVFSSPLDSSFSESLDFSSPLDSSLDSSSFSFSESSVFSSPLDSSFSSFSSESLTDAFPKALSISARPQECTSFHIESSVFVSSSSFSNVFSLLSKQSLTTFTKVLFVSQSLRTDIESKTLFISPAISSSVVPLLFLTEVSTF